AEMANKRKSCWGKPRHAQIGAFMIAHRIKRPTPEELAGMLDAYDRLGPKLKVDDLPFDKPVTVLGIPYDGRSRTVPVTAITALILAAVGVPVVMHGGDRMPTKYGIPLVEIWQQLGIDFTNLSLAQVQQFLKETGLGFIYLPKHFPLANNLVPYRDQIGKRPPFATAELIWSPCQGKVHLVAGFVHPPTEERFQKTLSLQGINDFTTVKGLEGSCDLACSRTAIIGLGKPNDSATFERLLLNPRDYGFNPTDVPFNSTESAIAQIQAAIQGKACELINAAIFNGGFYLWRCGVCEDLKTGFAHAEAMLMQGQVAEKLKEVSRSVI
ncbi:MAG: anthranilate phosphoribosyltransferase family protein, partial [Hydrococcus sp. RM1_1_31]|nr:anthranilate phosphoribosyltransferase family protein [Hydrococcus sp. RM1_1_31]